MTVFKAAGLICLLSASTFFGFYKSYLLLLRCKRLKKICVALQKLAQLINSSVKELDLLLEESFGEDFCNGEIRTEGLLKDDKTILNDLFAKIGIANREREYNGIILCVRLLEQQLEAAEEQYGRLSRLYNSSGFLGGLCICIFLI